MRMSVSGFQAPVLGMLSVSTCLAALPVTVLMATESALMAGAVKVINLADYRIFIIFQVLPLTLCIICFHLLVSEMQFEILCI